VLAIWQSALPLLRQRLNNYKRIVRMPIIEVSKLTKCFKGLTAVNELDFHLDPGEILGLIGPNGAGKTTVFNVISGVYKPTAGRVTLNGEDITGLKPHMIAKKGIMRTFQLTSLFEEYSVLENLLIGFHLESKAGFMGSVAKTRYSRLEEENFRQRALQILSFMGLESLKKSELGKNLPPGHRTSLGIAIAMIAQPKVLLLDEPLAGLNPEEVRLMMAKIGSIREEKKIPIVLVEHNMQAIMNICDRIVVINFGSKIAEGTPQEIRQNQTVIEAYLGRGNDT